MHALEHRWNLLLNIMLQTIARSHTSTPTLLQYAAWAVNSTSGSILSLNNYDATGPSLWFSFVMPSRSLPAPTMLTDGAQVALR